MNTAMTRAELDQLLLDWDNTKKEIERLKEREMDMRKRIAHSGHISENEGTNTAELGQGYKLKSVIKYNHKLDKDHTKIIAVSDALPPHIAQRLFKWDVKLSISEYRELDKPENKHWKDIVDAVLTVTESAPTVTIVEPKAKK